ncbi:MAG: hypothetical protein ACT4QF_04210 [Sporichthyaceae bacterium]
MELQEWLAAACLLHVGFQAVVSVVVYPALAATPVEAWATAHAAHSRRISWLVAPLYLALLVLCLAVAVRGPWTAGTFAALAGNAIAGLVTAVVAGPTHGRLGAGRTEALLARLLRADGVRLGGALLAGLGGLLILADP